jgi:CDP-glycerol glycerophosphotransferase
VIVPFFNAAGFLQECADSLVRQTLGDIEILLVDDGSTDESRALAGAIATADPRIVVLEQHHIGPGAARNRGLAAARAPYVAFVDSDDELNPDGCEQMLRRADESGADIVVARTHTASRPALPQRLASDRTRAIRGLYTRRVSMGAYAKLYRRSFLQAHDIRFPPAMYIEDRHFLLQCLIAGASLAPLEQIVYRRHLRFESTMHRISTKHVLDATAAYELDAALLDRTGLLAACGHHAAWATLVVDLYLARAIPESSADLKDTLAGAMQRQETLFRLLPGSRVRRSLLARAAARLRRDLVSGTGFVRTRAWLGLMKAVAL